MAEIGRARGAGDRHGRTLKATIDQLPSMECPQHRIVSLTGNIRLDGSAAYYNVIFSMADTIKARHFPMPLPVLVSSPEEREVLHKQSLVQIALESAPRRTLPSWASANSGPTRRFAKTGSWRAMKWHG